MVKKRNLRYFQGVDPSGSDSDDSVEASSRVKKVEEDEEDDKEEEVASDSGSEPESVSFQRGKETALQDAEAKITAIRANREKRKEQDRSKQETYLKQKKRADLTKEKKSNKLSENFLETISTLQRQRVTGYLPPQHVEPKTKDKRISDHQDIADQNPGSRKTSSLDYISLTKSVGTEFRSAALEEISKKPKSVLQEASDFKQKMLYGKRIHREDSKVFLNKLKKQRAGRHVKI